MHQAYDDHEVVRGLSFTLARGAIGCLLGPSGCGKTTVLRCIAGFEPVRRARSCSTARSCPGRGRAVPPEKRRIGMVFQDYALFPHLTVAENIAFGLHGIARGERGAARRRAGRGGRARRARCDKYPARALRRPAAARRARARARAAPGAAAAGRAVLQPRRRTCASGWRWRCARSSRHAGATAVLVTHDQHEAFAIADEIGVMHDGPHRAVGHAPTTSTTARRTASSPTSSARACSCPARCCSPHAGRDRARRARRRRSRTPARSAATPAARAARPTCCCGRTTSSTTTPRRPQAEVVHKAFRGAEILYTLKLASGRKVLALVPSHHNHALGERIGIRLDVDHVVASRRSRPRRRLALVPSGRNPPRISRAKALPRSAGGTATCGCAVRIIACACVVQHRAAGALFHVERRDRAVLADRDAHLDSAFPVVVLRDARIALVARRRLHEFQPEARDACPDRDRWPRRSSRLRRRTRAPAGRC